MAQLVKEGGRRVPAVATYPHQAIAPAVASCRVIVKAPAALAGQGVEVAVCKVANGGIKWSVLRHSPGRWEDRYGCRAEQARPSQLDTFDGNP